jgi:hypothetical protein
MNSPDGRQRTTDESLRRHAQIETTISFFENQNHRQSTDWLLFQAPLAYPDRRRTLTMSWLMPASPAAFCPHHSAG